MNPPQAELIRQSAHSAMILCPYCQRQHLHKLFGHGRQHFAPGCGLYRNPDDRARGYVFTTATRRTNRKDTTNG